MEIYCDEKERKATMKRLMSRLSVHVLLTDSAAEGEFFGSFFFFLFLHKQNHNWVFFFEICNFSFLISDISELSKIAISRWFVLIQLAPPCHSGGILL